MSEASEDSLALQKAIEEQLEVERKKTREAGELFSRSLSMFRWFLSFNL